MTNPDLYEVQCWERLIEGYSAMAKDSAGELEAAEWAEALIGDASAGT